MHSDHDKVGMQEHTESRFPVQLSGRQLGVSYLAHWKGAQRLLLTHELGWNCLGQWQKWMIQMVVGWVCWTQ